MIKSKHLTTTSDHIPTGRKIAVSAGAFPVQNGVCGAIYSAADFQIFLGLNPALWFSDDYTKIWDAFTDHNGTLFR